MNERASSPVSTATEQVLWRAEVPGIPNHLTLSPDELDQDWLSACVRIVNSP